MPVPNAQMGFVGSVRFSGGNIGQEILVRAKSCNIRARQDIKYADDIVDSRIDTTLYSLGPKIVEGNCSFPLVHEGIVNGTTKDCGEAAASCSTNLAGRLWRVASERDQIGRLKNQFNIDVRYTDNTAYRYPNCLINKMGISIVNEQELDINFDVIGGSNSTGEVREALTSERDPVFLSPARIVTWNDFILNIFVREEGLFIPGSYIREFNVEVDNDVARFFTLNGRLSPQDITARKRKVTGSIKLMGFSAKQFHEFIYNNQTRYTSQTKIKFGYTLGGSSVPYWATSLWGVLFQIEEVAISNSLIETTIPFRALGDCENDYEAIELGGCNQSISSVGGALGGPTSPSYFKPLTSFTPLV